MKNLAIAVQRNGSKDGQPPWLWTPGPGLVHAELQSMARAGLLRRGLGDCYVSADQPDTAETRAHVVSIIGQRLIGGLWTAELHTARWIHTGGCPPICFEASVPRYHRPSRIPTALPLKLRQGVTGGALVSGKGWETDVQMIGPVRCTIPEQTMEDLLRLSPIDVDPVHLRLLLRHCSRDELLARFTYRSYQAGMARGIQRLNEILDATGE